MKYMFSRPKKSAESLPLQVQGEQYVARFTHQADPSEGHGCVDALLRFCACAVLHRATGSVINNLLYSQHVSLMFWECENFLRPTDGVDFPADQMALYLLPAVSSKYDSTTLH